MATIPEQLALAARHHQAGRLHDAESIYRQILAVEPNRAEVHNNLGKVLNDLGKFDEAAACCRRALELKPDYAVAHNNLGNSLNHLGKLDEAVACYRQAVELKPDYAAAYNNLGTYYQQIGDFENAQRFWREALQHDSLHAEALAGLARLLRAHLPADEVAALARLAFSPGMTAGDRASLHFGMAHVKDAQGDFAAAAQHLAQANSLSLVDHQAHGHAYDPDDHGRFVASIIETFSPAYFDRVRGLGTNSERPVFIVGLPRTGTTLTEQILAGHTKVFGAGELQLAGQALYSLPQVMMKRATPLECVAAIDGATVDVAARQYLDRLEAFDISALRIVDKMPENYLYLGFLMTLFPNAKIIHCRRDVRDAALSCWMANFRQTYWSNRFDHIAARFHAYERLMEHWRRVLPAPMLEVDYETTVADFEGTARRLIDWCGLDWEPQCLAFHTRRNPVRTASAVQVRQPIYRHAVAKWKRYEDALAPLFALL